MSAQIENLEQRQYFASVPPSAYEQYMIELFNRARANPVLEALRYGIDLNEGLNQGFQITTAAKQPYAPNGFLVSSARGHANWMRINGQVSYVGANGTIPEDRMEIEGYVFSGSAQGSAENVAALQDPNPYTGDLTDEIDTIYRNWFLDTAFTNRPNRVNIMAEGFKEMGAGIVTGLWDLGDNVDEYGLAAVTDLALSTGNANGDVFLTGVAYDDLDDNNFYSPYVATTPAAGVSEGLGGVTITARNIADNTTYTTTTFGSGGYSLRLQPGQYDIIATGGGLGGTVRYPVVVIGSRNVKRDFTPDMVGSNAPAPGTTTPPPTTNPITLTGDLRGKVYFDADGDGRRDNEDDPEVLAGIRVYLDKNNNDRLDAGDTFAVTQANGAYRIVGQQPGIYTLRVDTPDGFRVSSPNEGEFLVKINRQRQSRVRAIALTEQTLIAGRVYRDTNANGVFDTTTDRGMGNRRVYIDLNNDGVWQREIEPSRRTNREGKYGFRELLPGTFVVRIVPRAGYLPTQPVGGGGYTVSLTASGIGVRGIDFGERLLA